MATTMISDSEAVTANALWTLIKPQGRKVRERLEKLISDSLTEQDEADEQISKAEVLAGIREGLLDVKADMQRGRRQKTLQEVIDEL